MKNGGENQHTEEFERDIPTGDLRRLAEFRYRTGQSLHFSEEVAHSKGIEPPQDPLLLAHKGSPRGLA
jgi:hypothetical protein